MNARGQALVEFALVLPVLLTLAFAMVQIAEIGVVRLVLEQAAAEGARAGALTNDDAVIRETVAAVVAPLDPTNVDVVVSPTQDRPPRTGDPRGSMLSVELRYLIRPIAFIPALAVGTRATRLVEWTP